MEVLSVSQLNRYVRSTLESNPLLGEVFIRGELSGVNVHAASGHLYFSLRDGSASVQAVMFKNDAAFLRFTPQNGLSVLAGGRATLYERDGRFQLYVSGMQLDGVGAMFAAYEQLKSALEVEGLFAQQRKRPLPAFPRGIGVVTSESGAALQDVIKVLGRRYPVAPLLLAAAPVQGPRAAEYLAAGLRRLQSDARCDVIILGRGGGSMEDLWAFNEEGLVRAVAASSKPVVSAVGHETDFTLCDFAADLRAPTPSAAAELIAPDLSGFPSLLRANAARMRAGLRQRLEVERECVKALACAYSRAGVHRLLAGRRTACAVLSAAILKNTAECAAQKRRAVAAGAAALDALSPLKIIGRGYTLTTGGDGRFFSKAHTPAPGQLLTTRYHWGRTLSAVTHVEVNTDGKTEL